MPKYGADGSVEEITLTTIKVRNFDNTITTIPAYAFVADSFKNWRGMKESGGRRLKRSLLIDVTSVSFCTTEDLQRLMRISLISDYLNAKQGELEEHNKQLDLETDSALNGRRLTNLGSFRAYVQAYLSQHQKIHREMTLIVRQLAPTECGIPLELYCFSSDTNWSHYESLQADIFDHLISALPEFGLRVFQMSTHGRNSRNS